MPLLFSLAVHNALAEVQEELLPNEFLSAFLDDVYVLSLLNRTREIYNLLADTLHSRAGIRLHSGKTRTWNRAAEIPEGMQELEPEVLSSQGLKVLGSPLGPPEYIKEAGQERLAVEGDFWRAIPWVLALQCAWQLLVQSGGPRCHHFLRTVPPSLSRESAAGHDHGMERVMTTLYNSRRLLAEWQRCP